MTQTGYAFLLLAFYFFMGGCMTEKTTMYFSFSDAKLLDYTPSSDAFYVRGEIHNGLFVPQSEVMGSGPLAKQGEPGWMELTSGQFYPTHTPRSPSSPYVDGYLTSNGFVPSSRVIK